MDSLCHPFITATSLSYSFLSVKLSPPPCAVLLVLGCSWLDLTLDESIIARVFLRPGCLLSEMWWWLLVVAPQLQGQCHSVCPMDHGWHRLGRGTVHAEVRHSQHAHWRCNRCLMDRLLAVATVRGHAVLLVVPRSDLPGAQSDGGEIRGAQQSRVQRWADDQCCSTSHNFYSGKSRPDPLGSHSSDFRWWLRPALERDGCHAVGSEDHKGHMGGGHV